MPLSGPTSSIGVLVLSDHALVAETVRQALHGGGIVARTSEHPGSIPRPRTVTSDQVGVLLSDLSTVEQLDAARAAITGIDVRWAVLTSSPRGPLWGGVLDAGAWTVMSSTTRVETLCRVIRRIAVGELRMTGISAEQLRQSWQELDAERHDLIARFDLLSPREREILVLLDAGDSVATISRLLGTSDATVRSQMQSLFRKLSVGSQLAAVAAYRALQELEDDPLAV